MVQREPEHQAYLSVLQEVSKVFVVCDVTEKFVACGCFPMREGWSIPSWLSEEKWIDGIPVRLSFSAPERT